MRIRISVGVLSGKMGGGKPLPIWYAQILSVYQHNVKTS